MSTPPPPSSERPGPHSVIMLSTVNGQLTNSTDEDGAPEYFLSPYSQMSAVKDVSSSTTTSLSTSTELISIKTVTTKSSGSTLTVVVVVVVTVLCMVGNLVGNFVGEGDGA